VDHFICTRTINSVSLLELLIVLASMVVSFHARRKHIDTGSIRYIAVIVF